MSERLLESILIQDGKIQNIAYHNLRLNQARKVFWPNSPIINLVDFIEIPSQFAKGKVKCRVLYKADIELVEFVFYNPKKKKNPTGGTGGFFSSFFSNVFRLFFIIII